MRLSMRRLETRETLDISIKHKRHIIRHPNCVKIKAGVTPSSNHNRYLIQLFHIPPSPENRIERTRANVNSPYCDIYTVY